MPKSSQADRRRFLKTLSGAGLTAGLTAGAIVQATAQDQNAPAARPQGSRYMGGFAAPALAKVRCAFIGVGARGGGLCAHVASMEGVEVVSICDLYADFAQKSKSKAEAKGHKDIKLYTKGPKDYLKMLAEVKFDAVLIATPWQEHAPMAIAAMKAGVHAFVEMPLAFTLQELWDIVDTSEATGKHCMMMENVAYGREELLFLNMCRQGVIGELLHGEAAYLHDLRHQMKYEKQGTRSWRIPHYANRNGNLYPTHGLGPVAQYMNIARREDVFGRLTSFSTPSRGRALYAKKNFPADDPWNQLEYKGGDLNTSIIKTHLGRTIMIQWNGTSPQPYSRHNLIQGTKGTLAGFPNRWAIEGMGDFHKWNNDLAPLYKKYEHPLFKRMGELATKMGGHGGKDFLMLYRMIECLRKGEALDQNLYEGAFWSAVGPLSEKSVAQDGMPQDFPDFTRGRWKDTEPLAIVQ